MKKYKYNILFTILALVALITFAGCQGAAEETELSPDIDIANVETYDIGQEVTAGDIVWEILEVEDLGTQLSYDDTTAFLEPEEGKFISITFYIKNTGEESKILYDLTAIDDQGNSYSICLPAYAFFGSGQACTLQEILPGIENTYIATFDVVTDVSRLVLQLTDLGIPPQDIIYVDLWNLKQVPWVIMVV